MNFKIHLIFALFIFTSCGVKGPPKPPKGSSFPSYEKKFSKSLEENNSENKEKEKDSP